MGIARFKDLCIDSGQGQTLGRFWADLLGLRYESQGQDGVLRGDVPEQTIWVNVVPEPKTVKHRVHLDVNAASVDDVVALGATVLEPAAEYDRPWTVMRDPEGGEFCVFERTPDALTPYRLHEVVVDAEAPKTIAAWWADVLGARLGGREDKDWWWLESAPGLPFGGFDFVPVPERKTVKNRVHWDVGLDSAADVERLVEFGASVLRRADDEIHWTVMADPEGNEFCVFPPE